MGKINFGAILTEKNNPATKRIDQVPIRKALELINREDAKVAAAVKKEIPKMEDAVRQMVDSIKKGGRLFFLGAGTSGRLGVMEAAECPPTFNTPPYLVQAFMAGGRNSVFRSKEGAEDRGQDARTLINRKVHNKDVLIGVAASGVTPFVREGLQAARRKGSFTILITCHAKIPRNAAHIIISPRTGPEVIAGSTRLKAATATKLILNSLTVATMIQLGKVFGNRMVDLQPKSKKLKARAERLIQELGKVSPQRAASLLKNSGGNAKTAVLMARKNISKEVAQALLKITDGRLSKAIALKEIKF